MQRHPRLRQADVIAAHYDHQWMGVKMQQVSAVTTITTPEDVLGESPVWRAEDHQLLWVDVRRGLLRCHNPATLETNTVFLESGAMGAILDRRGVVYVMGRNRLVRVASGGLPEPMSWHFELPDQNHRLNEVKCDRSGALWFGTMRDFGLTPTGSLLHINSNGVLQTLRRDVTVPNALGFSPDEQWVYFADTRVGSIERARFDSRTGMAGAWLSFISADAAPGRPDGLAIDADGFLWNARFGGSCVARFNPSGQLDSLVPLPVSQPTSCAFGGRDLTTLYITSARQGLDRLRLTQEPLAGAIFACQTHVPGHPVGRLSDAIV
jgi:sugar lactone lactonase YvrE